MQLNNYENSETRFYDMKSESNQERMQWMKISTLTILQTLLSLKHLT